MYKCEKCNKEFEKEKGLQMHARFCKGIEAVKAVTPIAPLETGTAATPIVPASVAKKDFTKYKELPPPIVEHLEKTYGNWLNYIEIGQRWRKDFGGYAMYLDIPAELSGEVEEVSYERYDNATRKNTGQVKVMSQDLRWINLKDAAKTIKYLDLVKKNILQKCYDRGLMPPTTNLRYESKNKSFEDYQKQIAGI